MTTLIQLNPSIPVLVVGKGTDECVGWLDYGPEHNLIWIVAMDDTGECWQVPNPDIRFLRNYSIGRNLSGLNSIKDKIHQTEQPESQKSEESK